MSEESVDDLRHQMRVVRRELHEDAEGVAYGAKELADWKHYVRSYPWVCVGVAALAGYLAVPSKTSIMRPSSDQLAELARRQQLVVEPSGEASTGSSWKGKAFSFATNMAMRAALAYVGQQFGKQAGSAAGDRSDS